MIISISKIWVLVISVGSRRAPTSAPNTQGQGPPHRDRSGYEPQGLWFIVIIIYHTYVTYYMLLLFILLLVFIILILYIIRPLEMLKDKARRVATVQVTSFKDFDLSLLLFIVLIF